MRIIHDFTAQTNLQPIDAAEFLNKDFQFGFEDSLKHTQVCLVGPKIGDYNSYYNCNIAKMTLNDPEKSISHKRKIINFAQKQHNIFLTNKPRYIAICDRNFIHLPVNLYNVIKKYKSGYKEMINESAAEAGEEAKHYAFAIHGYDDNKYSNEDVILNDDNTTKTQTTNLSWIHHTGFMFFDIDFPEDEKDPNFVPFDELEIEAIKLRQEMFDKLKDNQWLVMSTVSSSGKGVHLYTYFAIPSDFEKDISLKKRYLLNCHQVAFEQVQKALGSRASLIDNCSERFTQKLYMSPKEDNPLVNENFRLRVNIPAAECAMNEKYYAEGNSNIESHFKKLLEETEFVQADPTTYNISGEINTSGFPYYFGHGKTHDGVPTLHSILNFLILAIGIDKTIALADLNIYKAPSRTQADCSAEFKRYALNIRNKITDPAPYVMAWAKANLNIEMKRKVQEDCNHHYLGDNEWVSDFLEKDIESFLESEDKVLKIVAPPGTGKTEAMKLYSSKHIIDIIEPFNDVLTNKMSDFYLVTSATQNPYDNTKSCCMIPDQAIKHMPKTTKDLVIVDEIHEIWNNQQYRGACIKFLKVLVDSYDKIILMTGTPEGEDKLIPPDRTIYYSKENESNTLQWITTTNELHRLVETIYHTDKKIAIYANRKFNKIEEVLRGEFPEMNFLYMHTKYKGTPEYEEFLKTKSIAKYDGILYTKVLGVGTDILDEDDVLFIVVLDNALPQTGSEIKQAASRFRRAKVDIVIISKDYKSLEQPDDFSDNITEYAKTKVNSDVKRLLVNEIIRKEKAIEHDWNNQDGDVYNIDLFMKRVQNSIEDYKWKNSEYHQIMFYLDDNGFKLKETLDFNDDTYRVSCDTTRKMLDDEFLVRNVEELNYLYDNYKNNNHLFADFMRPCVEKDTPRIENGLIYVYDTARIVRILRTINKICKEGTIDFNNLYSVTNFSYNKLQNVLQYMKWTKIFNNMTQKEKEEFLSLSDKKSKAEFVREIMILRHGDVSAAKLANPTLVKKEVNRLKNKYEWAIERMTQVFKFEETIQELTEDDVISRLMDLEVEKKEKRILSIRSRMGKCYKNTKTGEIYVSQRELREKEKINSKTFKDRLSKKYYIPIN